MTSNPKKILFDTDIGSDIDDAVTLAYLLAQPECELLGITTVSGQPIERAKLASAICKTAGAEVPIIPGVSDRLDGPIRQPNVPQNSVLPNWDHDSEFPETDVVDFMAETIRSNPNEVTLLAVGPMTNVANLFSRHPDTPMLLGSLQMMIGRFSNTVGLPVSEWNAHCDPAAAQVIYSTSAPSHTSIGLDVTHQVVMDSEQVKEHFQHPLLIPVYEMSEVWFSERDQLKFHDPLAAVDLFDDSVCTYESGYVGVIRTNDRSDGETRFTADERGPHRIATTVKPSQFFESYFSVFT
ncbi:MAG: nucleoside hydrolase [Chloroflexi bacterium]|nr:nucleoside hydrolase [Chloroflexota bacterium]